VDGVRENEVTRVAAVLEHKQRGDIPAMLSALQSLWIATPEHEGEPDEAAADAWRAVEEAAVVDQAVEAGLALLHEGKSIRIHAFVDLTEHLPLERLGELAELVLAAGRSVDPYLVTVFMRIAEHRQQKTFWEVVDRHHERFKIDPEAWTLVAFVLATSYIGEKQVVNRWFEGWSKLDRVPMWLMAAWAGVLLQEAWHPSDLSLTTLNRLIELSTKVLDTLPWDDSAPFFLCWMLVDDLMSERYDTFLDRMAKHGHLLAREAQRSLLAHPIVTYANRFKHEFAIDKAQLESPKSPIVVKGIDTNRRPNRQLLDVVLELGDFVDATTKVFGLFVELHALPRRSARARELMREMAKCQPGRVRWVMPAWRELIKERVPWLARMQFEYLG
jgi:hypothetical protein